MEETEDKGLRQREDITKTRERRQVALNIYSCAFKLKDKRSVLGIEGDETKQRQISHVLMLDNRAFNEFLLIQISTV